MKPVDVNSSTYIEFDKENKFEVSHHAKILKYKNIFGKGYVPNWSNICN